MNNLDNSEGHQMVIYMSASPLNLQGTGALTSNLGGMVHIPPPQGSENFKSHCSWPLVCSALLNPQTEMFIFGLVSLKKCVLQIL